MCRILTTGLRKTQAQNHVVILSHPPDTRMVDSALFGGGKLILIVDIIPQTVSFVQFFYQKTKNSYR